MGIQSYRNLVRAGGNSDPRSVEDHFSDFPSLGDYQRGNEVLSSRLTRLIADLSGQGGGAGVVPAGIYAIDRHADSPTTGAFQYCASIPSNVTILCQPGARFTYDLPSGSIALARMLGSPGTEIPIAANLTRGDKAVETTTPHGLAVGDLIRIIGQRNCLYPADAGDWCLGWSTDDGVTPIYFSEWGVVASVEDTTHFTLLYGLTFPDYLTTSAGEAWAAAFPGSSPRTTTTIQKITTVRNAHWIGGEISLTQQTSQVFRADFAYQCSFRDFRADHGGSTPAALTARLHNCYDTNIINPYSETAVTIGLESGEHDDWNHIKIISSQDCEIRGGQAVGSSQGFDMTAGATTLSTGVPNINCNVIGFRSRRTWQDHGTVHPGAHNCSIVDNVGLDCRQDGIRHRGRGGALIGNILRAASEGQGLNTTGLQTYEGHARGVLVADNRVSGFDTLYAVRDANNALETFETVWSRYSNNYGSDGNVGFAKITDADNDTVKPSGLTIEGFLFERIRTNFVSIGDNCPNAVVKRNTFIGPPTEGPGTWVEIAADSPGAVVDDNDFIGGVAGDVAVSGVTPTETAVWPETGGIKYAHEVGVFNRFQDFQGAIHDIAAPMIRRRDLADTYAYKNDETRRMIEKWVTKPSDAHKGYYDDFFAALKAGGVLPLQDAIWLLGTPDDSAQALWNILNPGYGSLTIVGSVTHTPDRGIQSDGSTGKLTTTLAQNALPRYSLNSASMWLYSRTDLDSGAGSSSFDMGWSTRAYIARTTTNSVAVGRKNDATGAVHGTSAYPGFIGWNRSGAAAWEAYDDAGAAGSGTTASVSLVSDQFVLAGASANFGRNELFVAGIGESMTSTQWGELREAVIALATAVGANV